MSNGREFDKPGRYRIQVKAALDKRWSAWFDGWAIEHQADGETLLEGTVTDQTALHGILARVRDLGLVLLGVQRIELGQDTRRTDST